MIVLAAFLGGIAVGVIGTLAFFWFLDKSYELGKRDAK